MKLGVFYQSGFKLVACYMALQQLRKIYPDIPIALYEDGSDILKSVADEFNCVYKKNQEHLGKNFIDSGKPVIDLNSNLNWLSRIYEACTKTLKNVDWVILYEDDLWCKRKIERLPKFDLSGNPGNPPGALYCHELCNYLLNRFDENIRSRGHRSSKGSLVSFQACGGTIFNRLKFIDSYEKINKIDWDYINKMDGRICKWSDASLSFIMQHNNCSCGMWTDWGTYILSNTQNNTTYTKGLKSSTDGYDINEISIPMDRQCNVAFLHPFKYFYTFNDTELDLAKKIII